MRRDKCFVTSSVTWHLRLQYVAIQLIGVMKHTRTATRRKKKVDSSYKEVEIGRTYSMHGKNMHKKLRLECLVRFMIFAFMMIPFINTGLVWIIWLIRNRKGYRYKHETRTLIYIAGEKPENSPLKLKAVSSYRTTRRHVPEIVVLTVLKTSNLIIIHIGYNLCAQKWCI